jgi:23S rRNA pseudouridine1911/1915/1917 synthase
MYPLPCNIGLMGGKNGNKGVSGMDVQVVRDTLVVTPDKHQETMSIYEVCTAMLGLPGNHVRWLLGQHAVTVNKCPVSATTQACAGQRITLHGGIVEAFGVDLTNISPTAFEQVVDSIYEDEHLLVLNKPSGLIIYPGSDDEGWTLAHLVAMYYQQQGIQRKVRHVHRLDRDTTGAILYAKHSYSARALDASLTSGEIKRTYLALVHGRFSSTEGTIDLPIGRDRHYAGRYRVSATGKAAVTDYQVLRRWKIGFGDVSLVSCQLRTGRTHQIRVHLSELGHPIVGDELYAAGNGVGSIRWPSGHALHAWTLSFRHPYEHRQVEVEAALPGPFVDVMKDLGLGV